MDPTRTHKIRKNAYTLVRKTINFYKKNIYGRIKTEILTYLESLKEFLSISDITEIINKSIEVGVNFVSLVFKDLVNLFRSFGSGLEELRNTGSSRVYIRLNSMFSNFISKVFVVVSDYRSGNINLKGMNKQITKFSKELLNSSKRLLRTEIVKSRNLAVIIKSKLINVGKTVNYIWRDMRDTKVRDKHRERHNKIYSESKVRTLLGEPNCRCSIIPTFEKSNA